MAATSVLLDARVLLAREVRWCRGAFARTALGDPVSPSAPTARSFSLLGALVVAGREHPERALAVAQDRLSSLVPGGSLQEFNDRCTHGELLQLVDLAIEGSPVPAGVRS